MTARDHILNGALDVALFVVIGCGPAWVVGRAALALVGAASATRSARRRAALGTLADGPETLEQTS